MKLILGFLALMCSLLAQAQQTLAGVTMPANYVAQSTTLLLNGAGVREKYFMNMYVGALYMKSKSTSSSSIISENQTMAVKLHIVSSLITSEKMESAIRDGFAKTAKGTLSKEIEAFIQVFSEKIAVNDVFDLVYFPEKGVVIYKNKQVKGTIPGLEFKKALFGIWLGEDPADDDLKEAMLGN
ncbi:MAG: chalcone isomerase family protein [Cytophagaceae bacterium]|jgi:hypothetical protein|nr:chalcone isomerase family protein [Cytophagaceae bacterium]